MTNIVANSLLRDLVYAAEHGDTARATALLDLGVKPDEVDDFSRETALFAAARAGHAELVRLLLKRVTHPDRAEVYGTTALAYVVHELSENPSQERETQLMTVLRLLLEAGANPYGGSDKDQTPIYLARAYGMKEVESLLAEQRRI